MAAVTICSDFGAQKDEVWHCFHCFPIYLAWCDGVRCHGLRFLNVVVVQLLSHIWLFVTPWTATRQAFLSFTISKSLLKFMCIESVIHPTISSSVTPFSSCPHSSPASGSFRKSQLIIDPILFKAWKRAGERDRQERKKGGRERGRKEDISQLALQLHWFWSIRYKYLSLRRGFQKCPSMGADLLACTNLLCCS